MGRVVSFAVGLACGWVARSVSDSPDGAKLLEVAQSVKERVMRWVAEERERLDDMMAEAKASAGQESRNGKPANQQQEMDHA